MSVTEKHKTDCCGCNACAEICPHDCITMREDKLGFLYPDVDSSICVECGACEKVCPFPAKEDDLHYPLKAYAAWAKNEGIHCSSSSGGAAYILSEYILKRGGVVYGCNADGLDIRHIRIDSLDELPKLQGSKYVQSNLIGIFRRVKADLKAGTDVLFIGTPCQVAGLKKYLRKIPDNLLSVDLICHGTPSQKMLNEHIACVVPKRKIDYLSFRDGNTFYMSVLENGYEVWRADVWREPLKDMYYRAFMDGISYRPSCNKCCFGRPQRISDITIGDFWGINNVDSLPEGHEHGISVMLPATNKGKAVIDFLHPEMELTERSVDEAVNGNDQLRHPVAESWKCRLFRMLYPVLPFDLSVKIVVSDMFVWNIIRKSLRPLRPVIKPILNVIRR